MNACNRSEAEVQDLKGRRPSWRWRRRARPSESVENRRRSCSAPFAPSEPGAPIGRKQGAWLNSLRPWAAAIARRYHVRNSDVDDVVQETFAKVSELWPNYVPREGQSEEEGRRKWIAGIVWRTACNSMQRAVTREVRFRPYDDQVSHFPDSNQRSPEQLVANKQLIEVLLDAEGPESMRLVFSHVVETTPARELAELHGRPQGTVYSRVRAARQRMTLVLKSRQRITLPLRSR